MSASSSSSTSQTRAERGSGTELWLLRAGSENELELRLASFDAARFALVVCAPGGAEERWARALAARHGAPLECRSELAPAREDGAQVGERAWLALEVALSRPGSQAGPETRVLAVLSAEVLMRAVARALDLPSASADALRVDAGHAVCLRDDPIGIVLRRSNVLAPEVESGTALPDGGAGVR